MSIICTITADSTRKHFFKKCFAIVLACLFVAAYSGTAWGDDFNRIDALKIRTENDGVYIDAEVSLVLSPLMQEALEKGVSLYFVATADIERYRWYWFDATDAHATKSVRLNYHPLLRQYRVTIGGLNQSFSSLPEALSLLGQITNWRIADARAINASDEQRLIFIFELDHKRLPRLFQIGVTKEEGWQLYLKQEVSLNVSGAFK